MPKIIHEPALVPAQGAGKIIHEYFGRVNTGQRDISIAVMQAPAGWSEPFQTPEFNEYTVVLEGDLTVEYDGGAVTLTSGQAIVTESGERVRYSTRDGAYYVAICVPAFAPETVHRDRD